MDKTTLLANCFLFRGLPQDEVAQLAEIAEPKPLIAGEAIFLAGEPGDAMYLIRLGSVVVEKEGRELATLATGSHFGEVALLDRQPRSATVKTLEHTEVLEIGRQRFEELLRANPTLAAHVYWRIGIYLCSRLRRTNEHLAFFQELTQG